MRAPPASTALPGSHHLSLEFHALLGGLSLPGNPERIPQLLVLLILSTHRDRASEKEKLNGLRGDKLSPELGRYNVSLVSVLGKRLCFFDTAPPKKNQHTLAYFSSSAVCHIERPFVSFFIIFRYREIIHKQEHQLNLKLDSNNTALPVAPLQPAQSVLYLLPGKNTTLRTLWLTQRPNLRLVGVLGGRDHGVSK